MRVLSPENTPLSEQIAAISISYIGPTRLCMLTFPEVIFSADNSEQGACHTAQALSRDQT